MEAAAVVRSDRRARWTRLAKLLVSVSIVAYLVIDTQHSDPETFARLRTETKQWSALGGAWAFLVTALLLGWMRWRMLAGALGLPMRVRDAARLGFLGYMLDFLALGTLGGDLGRGILLGREHGQRFTEALASVVIDRLVGLWALSALAACGVLLAVPAPEDSTLATIEWVVLLTAASASLALVALLVPRLQALALRLARLVMPPAADRATRVVDALALYRRRTGTVALVALTSLAIPALNVAAFWLIARGLPIDAPSLGEHFVIIPPAMVSGAVPLPMEALGVFEYVINYLYAQVAAAGAPAGQGLLVALAYRALTITVILVGAPFYAWARATR